MSEHLFLSHLRLLDHGSSEHPENASRLKSILETFEISPYKKFLNLSTDRLATFDELIQVHDSAYVNKTLFLEGGETYLDPETILSSGSVKAALLAAGLGIGLIELVVNGNKQNGFAVIRPPGHHARPRKGMGFCLFNNIAIAAKKALAMGVNRLLILDWDVHHGNGTQETFYGDDRVFFIDLHQENLFPVYSGLIHETGKGKGNGFTVNIPLPAGCFDEDYFYVFDQLVKPLAARFQPELILVSAGFDAHESDPLGFMNLTTAGFGIITKKTKFLADQLCDGKLVLFLEGGYNPFFLAKNVMECVSVLVEGKTSYVVLENGLRSPSKKVEALVKEVYDIHFK